MALYNVRNPAVKRLMKEAEELRHPTEAYHAQPLEDNLFEWHFTLRGPPNSDFDGGIYHGRIILPPEYPMKPPSIIILTPNGRFETKTKICLSISNYHPETWQPSWSIRTALLAIIGFMPTHGDGASGALYYTPEERKDLALKSHEWQCPECGYIKDIFVKYYVQYTPISKDELNHSFKSSALLHDDSEVRKSSEPCALTSSGKHFASSDDLVSAPSVSVSKANVNNPFISSSLSRNDSEFSKLSEPFATNLVQTYSSPNDGTSPSVPDFKTDFNEPCSRTLSSPDDCKSNEFSELRASTFDSCNSLTDTVRSSVCHRGGSVCQNIYEDRKEIRPDPPKSYNFYSLCMWLIVIALLILCLRRLFSL